MSSKDISRDEAVVEIVTTNGSPDAKYRPVASNAPTAEISARRSGSASVLMRNEKGELVVERKVSDIRIALKTRLSQSSLPSILPIGEQSRADVPLNAEETLERTGGKGASGAYREHLYPLDVLADKMKTNIDVNEPSKSKGLSTKQAGELLKEYGPNVLTPPPRLPLWVLFLMQFTNLLMVLLEITALLCIILYIINPSTPDNLYLGVLLFIAIFVTCYETFSQEAKSDNLMAQFRALVPQSASVIRDGNLQPLPVSDLVLGDVIRLKAGDKVPADCRIILNESMKVTFYMFCSLSSCLTLNFISILDRWINP